MIHYKWSINTEIIYIIRNRSFFLDPFIALAENKYHVHNNNRPINNEYQTARVSVRPQWDFTPPYGRRDISIPIANHNVSQCGNDVPDADVPNEGNIVDQLRNNIPGDQSNRWVMDYFFIFFLDNWHQTNNFILFYAKF